MSKKIEIIIAGIGGVGGYFGGQLARHFSHDPDVDIYFLARGKHLVEIQNKGLKVIKGDTFFIATPKFATDNANKIGIADYILLCTKSYDLDSTINQLKPCIDHNTAILPLLNGVESVEKIAALIPDVTIFNGCVYVVSHLKDAGIVENNGNIQKLFFGIDNTTNEKLLKLNDLLKQANIESTLSGNISADVWEKFHLVGANSTATSYFDCSTREIMADKVKCEFLFSLLKEVNEVALASGIQFDKDIVAATIEILRSFPDGATSSMQRDFHKAIIKTELESITGFVVRAGQKLNVSTPTFKTAYQELLTRY